MTAMRLLAATGAVVVLAACSIGKPLPHATTYGLEPPPPAPATARRPETLSMGRVLVAPAFASKALVFRLDDVRYTADFYHAFIAEPGDLLGSRMAGWLDRAGPFSAVAQPGTGRPASYVLDAVVTELYGDFRPGRTPAAVMSVQFTLVDLTGIVPTVKIERTIGRRIDIAEDSPEALVRGYGQALAEILTEFLALLPGAG
jgi:cholesterol transport system auxiliary component